MPEGSCFSLALVAQLDRVLASEAKGRGFDSRRARHFFQSLIPSIGRGTVRFDYSGRVGKGNIEHVGGIQSDFRCSNAGRRREFLLFSLVE